jgi:hypothetical protein
MGRRRHQRVGGRASWGPAWAVVPRKFGGMAHFYTIPTVEKEIIHINHQPRKRDDFYCFFKRTNSAMAASPPLIIGDYFRCQAKGEASVLGL